MLSPPPRMLWMLRRVGQSGSIVVRVSGLSGLTVFVDGVRLP